jgi:transketolase
MDLKIGELKDIANVLRRDSLEMTSVAGSGHPTSCLSCAEIMSVLFFNEMKYDIKNPNNRGNDEFIMSKGHASPILYSALSKAGAINDNLLKLRKLNSRLEGHPVPRNFNWAKFATGSLGQGLSAGVGMALAGKLQEEDFRTYVLLGDSEMAEGSVYEACELASHYKLNNLIAILDVNRLGQRGETMLGHKTNEYKKRFESFGWNTTVVNGHDVGQLLKAFGVAQKSKKPFAIICKTFKGKGVSFLENKEGWHGKALNEEELKKALIEIPAVKMPKVYINKRRNTDFKFKFRIYQGNKYKIGELVATRDAYGRTLASLAKSYGGILAVDGEVSNSTKSDEVKKINSKQFIEAFIAEQNMIGMSIGLSKRGYRVFASSFAAFLSRAHDQIRMAALSDADIVVCGSHAGVSIGEDGASQMGLEDIGMIRSLPESIVFYPSDAVSTEELTKLSSRLKGIRYIRTTRGKTPVIYRNSEKFEVGDFKILKKSSRDKVVLVGSGITLHECLKSYEELKKKKIDVAVVDLYCVKPFNYKRFIEFVKKHGGRVVVVEDHYPEGGIGEMLASGLVGSGIEIKNLAVREVPHSGSSDELLKKYGIDSSAIVRVVKAI